MSVLKTEDFNAFLDVLNKIIFLRYSFLLHNKKLISI